jgi:HSP20 family protein
MAITRFDPFREFTTLQDRMNRLFGDVYLRDEDVSQRGTWVPPVDIFETEAHDLVIKAELPDMKREDIDVTVENNTLTLRGTKKPPVDVKDDQYRRIERHYGAFSRSFTLPTTVHSAKRRSRARSTSRPDLPRPAQRVRPGEARSRLPRLHRAEPRASRRSVLPVNASPARADCSVAIVLG